MKYIMLYNGENFCFPIIFPDNFVHVEVFRNLRTQITSGPEGRFLTCVGAGFIDMDTLTCYGDSETLDIKARPEDSEIIQNYYYFHGVVGSDQKPIKR